MLHRLLFWPTYCAGPARKEEDEGTHIASRDAFSGKQEQHSTIKLGSQLCVRFDLFFFFFLGQTWAGSGSASTVGDRR